MKYIVAKLSQFLIFYTIIITFTLKIYLKKTIALFVRKYIHDIYLRHGGYNEVADLNDIIILYPQAVKAEIPVNPDGCWDWWGYTGITYGNKKSVHF